MREGACEHTRWSFCFNEPSRETHWRRETADVDVSPCERAKRMYPVYMDGAVCIYMFSNICSVHFSCSVVSDSLWPHGLQHSRLPCPSPTLRVYPNSCPLGQWCHPTISSSVISFSSCPQSFPASGSFQMSQFFPWGGQSIGVSASASVLSMNIQDWFPLGWTVWISLVQGTLKILLQHHNSKASILWRSAFFIVQLSHTYMTSVKTIALTRWTFVGKVMSLLFNILSSSVTIFLPKSKHLLMSCLKSQSAVILEQKINK